MSSTLGKQFNYIFLSAAIGLLTSACGPSVKTHFEELDDTQFIAPAPTVLPVPAAAPMPSATPTVTPTPTLQAPTQTSPSASGSTPAPTTATSTTPANAATPSTPAKPTSEAKKPETTKPEAPKVTAPKVEEKAPLKPEMQALYKKLIEYRHPKNAAIKIPSKAADKFLRFFEENRNKTFDTKTYDRTVGVELDNLKYGVIIDYTAPSTRRRLFFVDLKTGEINAYYVAHGKGSVASAKDLSKWSQAEYFSNTEDSKASSLGFFISGESYDGKHGLSLRLHGIEKSNSRAFDRAIVMHGAEYVGEDVLAANGNKYMGMSWGCPALGQGAANKLIPLLAGGALIFSYHETNTPVAETKPYLLEPPKILAMILKSMPNQGPINIGKLELPKPEEDTIENEMPGEDHSPGAQAGNSKVKESEKD